MDKKTCHLTDEEKFQLELLADGDLDEESRRHLLLRLDEVQDGWRECSRVFLEAQCLKEALGSLDFLAESGAVSEKEPLTVKPLRLEGRDSRGTVRKRQLWPVLVSSACGFAAAFFLTGFGMRERSEVPLSPLQYEHEIQLASDLNSNAMEAEENFGSGHSEAAEETEESSFPPDKMIPPGLAIARNEFVRGNSSSAPPGGVGIQGRVKRSGAVMSSGDFSAETAADSDDSTVKHIILRRTGETNGITVPCVAAESYSPDNKAADRLAEELRKNGCGVETLHEELKFQLKDGKILIVPVDTINVRHPSDVHFL